MDFNFKKRFGQNFLTYFPEEMYPDVTQVEGVFHVVEIGPGTGALTKPLLTFFTEKQLLVEYHCVDIDPEALTELQSELAVHEFDRNRITMQFHNQDVLTVNVSEFVNKPGSIWILGSLPYNISKKIINWAFENLSRLREDIIPVPMKFIIQKEVAENYISKVPQADFLSHVANLFGKETSILKILPPGSFRPAPKVTSVVIKMAPLKMNFEKYEELDRCANFIHQCYGYRRKKIKFALRKTLSKEKLQILENNSPKLLEKRSEEIETNDFIRLFENI